MQHHWSQHELPRRRPTGHALALAAFACACATGVDVTDAELEEICSEPNVNCGPGGPPVGAGGSASGTGGNPFSALGGRSGSTATAGSFNTGGRSGSGTVTGGSSGSTSSGGGSAGTGPISGGNCAAIASPVASGGCAEAATKTITYTDRSDAAASQQLSMTLRLNNTGGDFNLTDLVIRYWFTADGQANFTGEIDYATLGGGADLKPSMCVAFGDQLGSQFADIGFTAGGTVGPTGIPDIQVRIHTQNYANLNQADDFSYVAGAAAAPNPNLAIYLAGALVGGCEP